jgi:phosphopantetheinyl transferase (holo-ACP synthase)
MHVHGCGVDVVKVARIARLVDRYGSRFLRRAFHPVEIERHERLVARGLASGGHQFLASRWAVKEATLKAFNGWRIPFPEVRIERLGDGGDDGAERRVESEWVAPDGPAGACGITYTGRGAAPRLRFDGALAELAASLRIAEHHVSLSHEEDTAMASVILLAADEDGAAASGHAADLRLMPRRGE